MAVEDSAGFRLVRFVVVLLPDWFVVFILLIDLILSKRSSFFSILYLIFPPFFAGKISPWESNF